MDPVLRAALTSWDLRIGLLLLLFLLAVAYVRGWWRVRQRIQSRPGGRTDNRWQAASRWRPLAYVGGLFIMGLALMSPIDVLSGQLFTMHMVQHVLLVMVVPPLLLLANPLPFFLWGLPKRIRLRVAELFKPEARFRYWLKRTTGAGVVWMLYVIFYWGWHDPNAYDLALRNALVHDLEHITFFGTSLLFWWHVIGAGPRVHRPFSRPARFAYLISAIPINMFAGIAIAFAQEPLYSYYEAMPRLWGLSVMDDQRIAGVIMWVPGSMMYMIGALALVAAWLQNESTKPPLPESVWATDEALMAPGWKER
ncbi:MAG: cytochrome c oxidase assembly protein [Candidatus Promineifilaceae bacterium]|nr:cytochrome c oxidase assembly protein [Candidatus Promineifilaceae bacterium]